jgi:hypothetical protein
MARFFGYLVTFLGVGPLLEISRSATASDGVTNTVEKLLFLYDT